MAGWDGLIHQSMFPAGSQSVHQPPAPPPSRRRGSQQTSKQMKSLGGIRQCLKSKGRGGEDFCARSLLATWGNTSCLWPSYLGEEAGNSQNCSRTGTPSFKAPCVLRKQLELLSMTLCISIINFLVVLKTNPLKITEEKGDFTGIHHGQEIKPRFIRD